MNRVIRISISVFILLMSNIAIFAQEQPSGESAKSFVAYLASDALEGRDTSSPAHLVFISMNSSTRL
ncbi:MAG: hypothetical protein MUC94_18295 [bacterium]|nr:hypothetical protein [bacterium]